MPDPILPAGSEAPLPAVRTSVGNILRTNNSRALDEPVEEETIDARRLLGILRRHFWLIIACVVGAAAAGLALSWWSAPVYEATASVRITENDNSLPGSDVLQALGGGQTEVNTELEVLQSRSLVQRVVDELGLR